MSRPFELPDLGEGTHEAEIQEVPVSEGDQIEEDQTILVVETDKASVDVPSPYSGVIESIEVESGDIVNVGDVVIVFGGGGPDAEEATGDAKAEAEEENADEPEQETEGEAEQETEEETVEATGDEDEEDGAETAERERAAPVGETEKPVPASPATRRLARELKVDLTQVPPSGPEGRVTAEDVRTFAEEGAEAEAEKVEETAPPEEEAEPPATEKAPPREAAPGLPDFSRWGEVERIKLRSIRRTISRRMAQSWSHIPHAAHRELVDITALERFRRRHKADLEAASLSLTVFVMKAATAALKEYPRFNASLDPDAQEIILKSYYHLGMAVDTDRGLIVPVIRDVDRKSIRDLAVHLQDLVQRTREGEISRQDMQGGTFTITNVGVLGGSDFDPIINHPQVAILGMAKAGWQPVVRTDESGEPLEIEPRFMLPLVLAFDHRVVDGADAARFMNLIIEALEDPEKLTLAM